MAVPKTSTMEANLSDTELAQFEDALQKKRREVVSLYEHDVKVGQESTDDNSDDFADRANNSYNRETMFALSDVERRMVIQIDAALERIKNGQFGICTHCGSLIGRPRLEAVPWAEYCIECQEKAEKGLLLGP
ncbi:MAG: TraR/DksA family transcriptional regulator [Thermoanaerobaculia bacterium]|nr:TraR/DksA family transcriptional regulator [Thermoanaerobaculia bacterium]